MTDAADAPAEKPSVTDIGCDINDHLKASREKMITWITSFDGQLQEVAQNSHHYGPVLKLTTHHAVQKTGRFQYTVHTLSDLDSVPTLNDKEMLIKYKAGLGTVIGSTGDRVNGYGHEREISPHQCNKAIA